MARPSAYTEEMADRICDAIIEGSALHKLCEADDFPSERTVYYWLDEHHEFLQKYARARELQQDREADNIVVIADEATDANIARLRIDARKWRAAKLAPKKYGDKLDLNHSGSIERLTDEQLDARFAQLIGKARAGESAGGEGAP